MIGWIKVEAGVTGEVGICGGVAGEAGGKDADALSGVDAPDGRFHRGLVALDAGVGGGAARGGSGAGPLLRTSAVPGISGGCPISQREPS